MMNPFLTEDLTVELVDGQRRPRDQSTQINVFSFGAGVGKRIREFEDKQNSVK